jgi:hypothetical protein
MSWRLAPIWGSRPDFYYCQRVPGLLMWGALIDERTGLQLMLVLASAVILRSESHRTHDHILLSQIPDSRNLEGQVPVFISPRSRVAQLYPQALGSLFVAFYDSQGYSGGICARFHAGWLTEAESYITTDGQSASLSWNKAPIGGLRPHFYYCQTVAGLLIWGALSDEMTGLSFTIAAGPRQSSHSRVRVLWGSRPYFTVSDSRLTLLLPPRTRKATVVVSDLTSTREGWLTLHLSCL